MADETLNETPAQEPTAQEPKAVHELNPNETAMLTAINNNGLGIKARLYDLQQQTTAAERDLQMIQKQFDGAVFSMGTSHGIENPRVTPDFKRIVRGN